MIAITRRCSVALLTVTMALALGVSACDDDDTPDAPDDTDVELANPASVFCEQEGGEVEIVEGEDGQQGICVLPDGTRIDEWEYFRTNATTVP